MARHGFIVDTISSAIANVKRLCQSCAWQERNAARFPLLPKASVTSRDDELLA